MIESSIKLFNKGVHNLLDDEVIPKEAAQDAYNWIDQDGVIELARGRRLEGAEGAQGSVQGEIFGFKNNGKVHWRKIKTKIQYLNGTTWTDVVTGLTDGYKVCFQNYSSLAGNFTYAFSLDGIFKFNNANPGSYISLYDATKNYKFTTAVIDKGRTLAAGRPQDRTGLYLSRIDTQKAGVSYTQVTAEVLGSGNGSNKTFAGTLAFKGSNPKANAFGLVIVDATPLTETFTDNGDGTLTGSAGGTGTINYVTGAYSVTFITAPSNNANNVTGSYLWEDSNVNGVTDFTFSSPRVAGEGDVIRQDEGGDPILTIKVGLDGAYYSLKSQSAYRLVLDAEDLTGDNQVFRRDIGIISQLGATSTQKGIVFINTANLERPECTILQQNPIGGNVEPFQLFPHFKFQNYLYDVAVVDTFGRYVLVSCKTLHADNNDTTLLLDMVENKVNITGYGAATFAKNGDNLYMGSPLTETVYQIYDGFDDDGTTVQNYWTSKGEMYGDDALKKFRRLRLKGFVEKSQSYGVYISYDDAGFGLVGTVLGTGTYVDITGGQTIGANMIGAVTIGGDNVSIVYPYYLEIKIKPQKFRKRTIKFVALGYGYVNIDLVTDFDIWKYEQRIPKRFRLKQYVSLDGETVDNNQPEF